MLSQDRGWYDAGGNSYLRYVSSFTNAFGENVGLIYAYVNGVGTANPYLFAYGGCATVPFGPMIYRAVEARLASSSRFPAAMVAKNYLDMNGNSVYTDSYDSTDPSKSTGGLYDAAKRQANGDVASNEAVTNTVDISIGNADIYGRNLITDQEFVICTDPAAQRYPRISGNVVVWQDSRNATSDIYGKDLSTDTELVVCGNSSPQFKPAISGGLVVWADQRNGGRDVYGSDLAAKADQCISSNAAWQDDVDISDDLVVWLDSRNGKPDLWGRSIGAGKGGEFEIVAGGLDMFAPAISGQTLVWQWGATGDIYGMMVETAVVPEPAAGLLALAAAGLMTIRRKRR